jgi:transposase, IS30 family
MGKYYDQLDQGKRDRIKILLDEKSTYRAIGRALNIDHSTVSREVDRNSYGNDNRTPVEKRDTYDSNAAERKATNRRRDASWQGKKIEQNTALRSYVIDKLKDKWNPDEIAGHMKKHKDCSTQSCLSPDAGAGCSGGTIYASKNTIYEWLRSAWGQQYCEFLYSKRYRKKPRPPKKTKRQMIQGRTSIHDRPEPVNDRSEPGHWEKDAIVSSKRSGSSAALSVDQERKTRYANASVVGSMKPSEHVLTAVALTGVSTVLSITYDNGIENKDHIKLRTLGVATYFADPYCSSQKGSVENLNKMIRRDFPKGTNFATVSQTEVDETIRLINNKPRKILGYKSALQAATEEGVLRG